MSFSNLKGYSIRPMRKWEESQPWWVALVILGTGAMVGGQGVGWCDQRHSVPTANALQEAARAGNTAGGKLLAIKRELLMVPGEPPGERKSSGYSPPVLAVHYICYQWLCFYFHLYGFIQDSQFKLHFFFTFLHKQNSFITEFLKQIYFQPPKKFHQLSHIVLYFTNDHTPFLTQVCGSH